MIGISHLRKKKNFTACFIIRLLSFTIDIHQRHEDRRRFLRSKGLGPLGHFEIASVVSAPSLCLSVWPTLKGPSSVATGKPAAPRSMSRDTHRHIAVHM